MSATVQPARKKSRHELATSFGVINARESSGTGSRTRHNGGAACEGCCAGNRTGLIARDKGWNTINSISPKRPFYQDAVDRGEAWLKGKGL
jgi:hypothetical protein